MSQLSRPAGVLVDFPIPKQHQVCVEDVAHALSNQCRFAGWTREFFSIAQHSIEVATRAEHIAKNKMLKTIDVARAGLAALYHDAPEYVTGDITYPMRTLIGQHFCVIEKQVEEPVYAALGVTSLLKEFDEIIIQADEEMLLSDMARWDVFGEVELRDGRHVTVSQHLEVPSPHEVHFAQVAAMPPIRARETFLRRSRELRREARM